MSVVLTPCRGRVCVLAILNQAGEAGDSRFAKKFLKGRTKAELSFQALDDAYQIHRCGADSPEILLWIDIIIFQFGAYQRGDLAQHVARRSAPHDRRLAWDC